jgi:thiamine-monophosphate kinase
MNIFAEKSVSSIGEKNLISKICNILADVCPPSPFGSGDDCALLNSAKLTNDVYITVDSVIYGKHFDESCSPELVGAKLLKRNISDIASMGASPTSAVCAGIISGGVSLEWIDAFTKGLALCAKDYGVNIVGGDIASTQGKFFSMSLTLLGQSANPRLLRNGAEVGDYIFTTGELGFSFETSHHLTFLPRVEQGEFLAKRNLLGEAKITSCTDISDGLASDINNILSPNCKAVLDFIPQRCYNGKTLLEKSLCDGEDYELLFSVRASEVQLDDFIKSYEAKFGSKPILLGKVQKKEHSNECPLWLNFAEPKPFSKNGFEHFC